MILKFLGAAHEVTGSCFYLEAADKKILIDCGMEQGEDIYVNQEIPVNPSEIDCVLLTHAHIDHSGMIPMLYGKGFRGSVYATEATCELCDIMLRDSAHIQQFEMEWKNRKARRAGKEELRPVYTMEDAFGSIRLFVPCSYNDRIEILDGIHIRFTDVGHLLGSSSIEVWIRDGVTEKKIAFSGDIGNKHQPLLKDPEYIREADYVVMESTYGDRSHGKRPDYISELSSVIQKTFDRGGNVVIPSFAVGRTQELLYFIRQIKEENLVKNHGKITVYVDSPLAVEATHIFKKNYADNFDEEALALIEKGVNPISFPGLRFSVTSEESKAINMEGGPKIIISASGMCEAGRIRHHLKHNLWRAESTVLFVGYQAYGTLGRAIVEGASSVKLFGEEVEVKAEIRTLSGISGHADKEGLVKWITSFEKKPDRVFVVHGEDTVCDKFAGCLQGDFGYPAEAPYPGAEFDLIENRWIFEGSREKVEKGETRKRSSAVFERLLAAGYRLIMVIKKNEGGANKDLGKFTDQINSLCDKWQR